MAERYKRLQILGENMWCKACPVMLYKGALLHDNQMDKNLMQLGFVSLAEHKIVGLDLSYKGYSLGNELIIEDVFSYLDLDVAFNDRFGEKTPVYLKNNNIRKFVLIITKVYYESGEIWENTFPLKKLGTQVDLKKQLNGLYGEFIRLYNRPNLNEYLYVPQISENVWRCTCGTLNLRNRICRYCGIEQSELLKMLSKEYLQNSKDEYERKEEERKRREREENERKIQMKKKLQKKIAVFSVIGVIFLVLGICINQFVIEPRKHAASARQFLNAKNYEEADKEYKKAYGSLENVNVSDDYYNLCVQFLESEDYKNAEICYEHISDKTKKEDEKLNNLWKDSCLKKTYISLQVFEERYGHIKNDNVRNDDELNKMLIETGDRHLENLHFDDAKSYLSKVTKQYEKNMKDTIFATSKRMIESGKYVQVIENCFEYFSETQINSLSKLLKKAYLISIDGAYSNIDNLLQIKKYLSKNEITSIKKTLYVKAKKNFKMNGENGFSEHCFKILEGYRDSEKYLAFLDIIDTDDVPSLYLKLKGMDSELAQRYLRENEKIKTYRNTLNGIIGSWTGNNLGYDFYVTISETKVTYKRYYSYDSEDGVVDPRAGQMRDSGTYDLKYSSESGWYYFRFDKKLRIYKENAVLYFQFYDVWKDTIKMH